jgi:hypothetical protein
MPKEKVQKAKKTIVKTDKKIPKIRVVTLNENPLTKKGIGQTKCACQKCPCPCDDDIGCLCEPVSCPCIQHYPPCPCMDHKPQPTCPQHGCKTDTCGCQGYCPNVKPPKVKGQGGSRTFFKIAGNKDKK